VKIHKSISLKTNCQKRINSDGTYYHEDCFNTLMEAIDESKKQVMNTHEQNQKTRMARPSAAAEAGTFMQTHAM
jgi:hypothetical protein